MTEDAAARAWDRSSKGTATSLRTVPARTQSRVPLRCRSEPAKIGLVSALTATSTTAGRPHEASLLAASQPAVGRSSWPSCCLPVDVCAWRLPLALLPAL